MREPGRQFHRPAWSRQADEAWRRACSCNARVQARLERLHDVLINLTPPPMAALRELKALESALVDEGYAIQDTLSALERSATAARQSQAVR